MTLPVGAPPALVQVAQRYAETTRGVVTFQMHRVFDVHDPFRSRHEDLVMNGVYDDGVLVRVHVISDTVDRKPASASDIAKLEQSWDHPNAEDVFAPPFDARNFDAYQYRSGGASTIEFTSNVHGAGHGNGSFTYDSEQNVVSDTYQPNALPQYAHSAQITDRRAEVLSGYWAPTEQRQQYKGNVGPFAGSGTIQIEYSGFRRFPDLQSALLTL
ncbi:MAG TPA: hypothetical protein VIX60_02905 [Candidatus Cybelea sp.]